MARYRYEVIFDDTTDSFEVSEPECVIRYRREDVENWDPTIAEWGRDHILTSLGEEVL